MMADADHSDLPPDLLRVLRDQSIVVPQDGALWAKIAEWQNAPSNTASADLPTGRGRRMMEPCTCGHAPEEHVQSAGLGACEHEDCECIQYEADEEWDADD